MLAAWVAAGVSPTIRSRGAHGAAFTDGSGFPGQPQFKQLIVNGIKSAMGLVPFCSGRGLGRD